MGMDMGKQGTMLADIKAAGLKVLLVPVAVGAGTLLAAGAVGLFLPMGVKDAIAASAGFGWYSLAPTLLAPSQWQAPGWAPPGRGSRRR